MAYLSSLLVLAVFLSFMSLLSPMKESVRRACLSAFSVIFLLALIPKDMDFSFKDLLSVSDHERYESAPVYWETWKEGVEEGLLRDLVSAFSLDESDISLESRLAQNENTVTVDYLSITLTGSNIYADAPGIARYIQKHYGCLSEIHIKKE